MCITPIKIKNKTRVQNPKEYAYRRPLSQLSDLTSQYIEVPCGHCSDCITMRQNYIVQRFRMASLVNDFWFCTLTVKPSLMRSMSFNLDNGSKFTHDIACKDDLQKFFKRLRKRNVFGMPFKYYCVSEYGGKKHRPHYHIIFTTPKMPATVSLAERRALSDSISKKIFEEWSINVGTRKNPVYEPLCEYHERWINGKLNKNYDFHYIEPYDANDGIDNVAFYVSKYILKVDDYVNKRINLLKCQIKDPDNLSEALSLFRPFSLVSKHFGDVQFQEIGTYIERCIQKSLELSRLGQNPINDALFQTFDGKTFPMSPYYKKKVMTPEVASRFQLAKHKYSEVNAVSNDMAGIVQFLTDYDNFKITPKKTPTQVHNSEIHLRKLTDIITKYNE